MKALAYLNKYLLQYKYHLLIGVLLVFLNNIFATLIGPLTREILDIILEYYPSYSTTPNILEKEILLRSFRSELLICCGYIIGSAVLSGLFLYYQRKILISMSRYIEYDLKNEIYKHYQSLPLSFYKRNNTGDLMNRISEDVSHVRQYLGPSIMYGLNLIAIFAVSIPFMLSVNLKLTLFTLLPLPLLALSIYIVHNIITKTSEEIQRKQSDLSTFIQEAFSGIRVIKSFTREKDSEKKFNEQSNEYKKHSIKLSKINALFFPIIMTLIGLSNFLIIYIGGLEVIKGNITYGNIAEFIIYLNRMSWPVASLGWTSSLVQRAEVSQQRINEFLEIKTDIVSEEDVKHELQGNVIFKNVSFTYPDTGIEALKNISFEIKEGETLAIVGNTGSGKSSVAALLCRLYDTTKGDVMIDNKNIKEYNIQNYRRQLGYVPQDVFLFSDTIRNNISFGTDNSKENTIIKASKDADLYDNIQSFPDTFNTVIGERGITLSGGQKQRLSIARAIIRNPKILILDDCLSAVDTKTENNILNNLSDVMKERTSVIISHRVSSVKLADKIILLEDGKIIEQGTHNDLMALKGTYKELYQKQLEEGDKL